MSWARAERRGRRLLAVVLPMLPLLLVACGGGDGVRDSGPAPERVTLSGRRADAGPTATGSLEARPREGLPTVLEGQPEGRYTLVVEQMTAPYVLLDNVSQLMGVGLGPGTAHVTLLTHLLLAELQGDDPLHFFSVLGPAGAADFSRLTADGLADAEQRLRQRLQRQLGLAVPAAVVRFTDTPFEPVAGDPMADLLAALDPALLRLGLARADLVAQVALHGRQCDRARVDLADGSVRSTLCPARLAGTPVAAEPGVTELRFADDLGDTLLVRLQADGTLRSVRWLQQGRERAACDGAACTGITVGAADADGRRVLRFEAARIGSATASGTLASGDGEVLAPCAGRRFTAQHADGSREEDCVSRRVSTRQYARLAHAFIGTLDGTRALDVRLDGDTVVWVALMRTYGGVDHRCVGAECRGVTLGPPDAAGVRRIVLAGTTLVRALGGGQVDPLDTVQLQADLLSAPTPPPPSDSCPGPVSLQLISSDGITRPLCDLNPGSSIGFDDTDGDGRNETVSTSSSNAQFDSVDVVFDLDRGQVTALSASQLYLDAGTLAYVCDPQRCGGVSGSLTADSRFLIRFDDTVLAEVLPDGTPGTRELRLRGTVLSGALVVNPGD